MAVMLSSSPMQRLAPPIRGSLLNLNISPEDPTQRVLVLGDGDLSYSLSLARSLQRSELPASLVATCYLTGDELATTHPGAEAHTEALMGECGAIVVSGVDATRLHDWFSGDQPQLEQIEDGKINGLFDRVVWNFPQHAERKKIQRHRELLEGFFASAGRLLAPGGSIWVTLKGGQGGTASEREEYAGRPYGTTWQVEEMAARSDLVIAAVSAPDLEALHEAGYRSVGFRGSDRGFWLPGSLTHVLCRPTYLDKLSLVGLGDGSAAHPTRHKHDLSFWVEPSSFSAGALEEYLDKVLLVNQGVSYSVDEFDSYQCPKTGRQSRTFHVEFWAEHRSLTREQGNSIMREVFMSSQTKEWCLLVSHCSPLFALPLILGR